MLSVILILLGIIIIILLVRDLRKTKLKVIVLAEKRGITFEELLEKYGVVDEGIVKWIINKLRI